MKRMFGSDTLKTRLGLIILVLSIAGCTKPPPEFTISGQNVQVAREIPSNVKLGPFTGSQNSVSCRAGNISPAENTTYATYIRDAFEKVLRVSKTEDKGKTIELSGKLLDISLDCGMATGLWVIDMEFAVDNQTPFKIETVYEFDGNFVGAIVFQRARDGLIRAVQRIVNDVLQSPQVRAAAG